MELGEVEQVWQVQAQELRYGDWVKGCYDKFH